MTTQKRPQNCGTSYCSCIECVMEPDYKALWEQVCERCDELDEKLAQLEQEPVEWGVDWGKDGNSVSIIKRLAGGGIEVVGWEYAPHPPQREWVRLTDEDFLEACQIAERGNYLVAFQRIQAKLKEKNT